MDVYSLMETLKIIPVVKLSDPGLAPELCGALCAGGLPAVEITFRAPGAERAIRNAVLSHPDMLVGAGTVTNLEQARRALDAGAKFLISPGLSESVVLFGQQNNLPVFPGVCTPTEVMRAMDLGLNAVKFFPAQSSGGVQRLKALAGPFPALRFMPTGGIGLANLREYLSLRSVMACGGSWMAPAEAIQARQFDLIREKTCETMELVRYIS